MKMYFLLKRGIFHCHVSLPEGNHWFPLIRPAIKPFFPEGRYVKGGGRLTRHEISIAALPLKDPFLWGIASFERRSVSFRQCNYH